MNTRSRTAIALAAALVLAGVLPALAQKLDTPSATPASGTNRPVDVQGDGRQQALDLATTARVKAVVLLDSELKTQTILIDTVNGTVRLTGQVTSTANFDRVKALVSPLEGVKNIENLLIVRELVKPS